MPATRKGLVKWLESVGLRFRRTHDTRLLAGTEERGKTMEYTKGEWMAYRDTLSEEAFFIDAKHTGHEKEYTEVAIVFNKFDACLITIAVNACIAINPDNPIAVARGIKDMHEALSLWNKHQQGTRGHYCEECADALTKALDKAERGRQWNREV